MRIIGGRDEKEKIINGSFILFCNSPVLCIIFKVKGGRDEINCFRHL